MSWLKRRLDYITLLTIAALAHALLPLNDGIYWDDWLAAKILDEKRWDILNRSMDEMGATPPIPQTLFAMEYLPGPVHGGKILAFGFLLAIAFLLYRVCTESRLLSRGESLAVALFAVTFPAYQTTVLVCVASYLLCYALFLGALLLSMQAQDKQGLPRIARRVVAALLFLLSFGLNSLLVFLAGALVVLFARERKREAGLPLGQQLRRFVPRHLELLVLPVAYWIIKQAFFPRHASYSEYNRFRLSPVLLVGNAFKFVQDGVVRQIDGAFAALVAHPLLVAVVAGAAAWTYGMLRLETSEAGDEGRLRSASLALFAVFLFGCGIFPYAAVGLAPALHGKATRNAILVGLPVALMVVAIGRRFLATSGTLRRSGFIAASLVLAAFCLSTGAAYLGWQARWVKDQSIVMNLRQMPEARSFSTLWVDDGFLPPETDRYSYYDWSSMFRAAWGDQSHIGFDDVFDTEDTARAIVSRPAFYLGERYNLADYRPDGPVGTLTVRRGRMPHDDSDLALTQRYLFYKLTRSPNMSEFLRKIVTLEVRPGTRDRSHAPEQRLSGGPQ